MGTVNTFLHVFEMQFLPGTDETIESVWKRDFSEWEVYPPILGHDFNDENWMEV